MSILLPQDERTNSIVRLTVSVVEDILAVVDEDEDIVAVVEDEDVILSVIEED